MHMMADLFAVGGLTIVTRSAVGRLSFAAMFRVLASLLIAAASLPFLMTAFVLVRFHVERERIIKEVCAQRSRPVEQNCCKGSCHLEKQLKDREGQKQSVPLPLRLELREEPAVAMNAREFRMVLAAAERLFGGDPVATARSGHPSIADPVPWG